MLDYATSMAIDIHLVQRGEMAFLFSLLSRLLHSYKIDVKSQSYNAAVLHCNNVHDFSDSLQRCLNMKLLIQH